jgi:hypothetical protein
VSEAEIQDVGFKLRTAAPPIGESPAERHSRLEMVIAERLEELRGRLRDTRVVTEPFLGARPVGLNVDLGDVCFDARVGQRFSLRSLVGRVIIDRYGSHLRVLSAEEIERELAEAEASLKWRLLQE